MRKLISMLLMIGWLTCPGLAQSNKPTPTPSPSVDDANKIVDPVFSAEKLNSLPTKTRRRHVRGCRKHRTRRRAASNKSLDASGGGVFRKTIGPAMLD
jgi:hypothetical protein